MADIASPGLRRTFPWGWVLAALLMAAYAVIFGRFGGFSLQDYPNHLARGVVMSDLMFQGGARFGAVFHYHFAAVAYILGDIVLASAVDLFGPQGATTLWIALTVLSLPLALMFYLRGTALPAQSRVLLVVLSLYLSTDGFLYMGFMTFRLAVALTLLGISLAQLFRRRSSSRVFAGYCGIVVLGYLVHLSSLLFLVTAVAASGAVRLATRETKLRTEAALFIPIVAVAAWHLVVAVHSGTASDLALSAFNWGTWSGKLHGLRWDFLRYYDTPFDGRLDNILILGLIFCVLWPVRGQLHRRNIMRPVVLELFAIAAAFLAMYVVLPSSYGDASYLDLRPLAMVPLFLMLACLQLRADDAPTHGTGMGTAAALACAVLLTVGNLAYLTGHMARDGRWMAQYRAIVAAIPRGASVLPLYPGTNALRPYMHAGAFAVIDRGAVIPYLFSGNRGNPQTYFRYNALPYAPPETWYYTGPPAVSVNWNAISCSYDYLLAMKPFDLRRLPIAVRLIRENEGAMLLAVSKQDCPRRVSNGV
jgi:hypothetical protein